MNEFLRTLHLGTINLFGIAVPGFLLLFSSVIGFLLPFEALALNLNNLRLHIDLNWYNASKWIFVGIFILISYVAGYILRLASPDTLDQISATKMHSDVWDKEYKKERFPYITLRSYLNRFGHPELAKLIPWDPDNASLTPAEKEKEREKCSNTIINTMKIDVMLDCPELATVIDSNEAHIRLMSGTWFAIRATKPFIYFGLLASLLAIVAPLILNTSSSSVIRQTAWYYSVQAVLNFFMLLVMAWGQRRIQKLFHRQRVRELLFILHAKFRAQKRASITESAARKIISRIPHKHLSILKILLDAVHIGQKDTKD